MGAQTDIRRHFRPDHNEVSRQAFVSALRKFVMVDMREPMRTLYDHKVAPEFKSEHGHSPESGSQVRSLMKHQPYYQVWSTARFNAQVMTWDCVMDAVERALPDMIETAKTASRDSQAGGTLHLDPDLEIPAYVSKMDIHLMPGNYHTEFTDDDVAQGAIYTMGTDVFSDALRYRRGKVGAVAQSIAHYLKLNYPELKPQKILDLGCSAGKNLFPYNSVFPDALLFGVDVAAPLLRFGHAVAEADGVPVHFSQQNAEHLNFENNSFDVITSSFLFHELPVNITKQVLSEALRVLKPGGVLVHMELPPHSEADAYYNFYLDWDNYYNNEPYYKAFRSQNLKSLCREAGFAENGLIHHLIPNYSTFGREAFEAFVRSEVPSPAHGNGASWFIFGAQK